MLDILNEIFSNPYTNFWHRVEIMLIAAVITYQLFHTVKVTYRIKQLKKVFSHKLYLRNCFIEKKNIGSIEVDSTNIFYEDNLDSDFEGFRKKGADKFQKLTLVDTKGENEIIKNIKNGINTYLINNYGASVNFSIIKDIVDREVEVKDEEVSQSISLPLYLGLAATMIGIIFGLFSMPELDSDGFSVGIDALISGVKIAMIGSLAGLACTTYLSSFVYKRGKRVVQKEKNEQLTYLQGKLLPELIKSEDTGVSGLKASLDRFARVATNVSDSVLTAANQTGENLDLQRKLINKVEKMEVLKVSKSNLELFDKMDANMHAFENFSKYLANMERITAQLDNFSSRTADVDKLINSIDKTLNDSKQLMNFLNSHFEEIKGSGNQALNAVGLAESHFEESIKELREKTDASINKLYQNSGEHESRLEDIYEKIDQNLNEITTQYISSFKDAYSQSIPKFEQLDKLSAMDDIKYSVKNIAESDDMIKKLSEIEDKLGQRQNSNGSNAEVIEKLEKISNKISHSDNIKPETSVTKEQTEKKQRPKKQEEIPLSKVFKELFGK